MNSPLKGPVKRKMFPFDGVIINLFTVVISVRLYSSHLLNLAPNWLTEYTTDIIHLTYCKSQIKRRDLRTLAIWKEVMKFQIKLKRDISLNYSLISIPDRPDKSKLVQCIPQIIYAVWDCSLLGCSYIVSSQESLSLTWFNFNPNKDE